MVVLPVPPLPARAMVLVIGIHLSSCSPGCARERRRRLECEAGGSRRPGCAAECRCRLGCAAWLRCRRPPEAPAPRGTLSRSVWGRKRADMYSSMNGCRRSAPGRSSWRPRRARPGACSRRAARVGAQDAGVAEEAEALGRQVGQQADVDGLLDVDVLAEGAADEICSTSARSTPTLRQRRRSRRRWPPWRASGCRCRLGEHDVVSAPVSSAQATTYSARRRRSRTRGVLAQAAVDVARLVEHAGDEELAEQVDQAAAADAQRRRVAITRYVGSRSRR